MAQDAAFGGAAGTCGRPERFAQIPDADLPDSWDYNFVGNRFDPKVFGFHWKGLIAQQYIRPTVDGLRMTFPPNEEKGDKIAGVHPKLRISGDFVATLDYTGLTTIPVKESWGSGLSFKVTLYGPYETGIEARTNATTSWTNAIWQFQSPLKQTVHNYEALPNFPESGRLRLVRRGAVMYYLVATSDAEVTRKSTSSSENSRGASVWAVMTPMTLSKRPTTGRCSRSR